MSLHPIKRSDRNKAWNQGRNNKAIIIQPEYQLIVTEGTDTEPNYFNSLADIVNSKYHNKINVSVEGIGDNTLNLLKKAQNLVERSFNDIKHVWLIYDTDSFSAEHINLTATLCEQYSNKQIKYHTSSTHSIERLDLSNKPTHELSKSISLGR